VEGRQCRGGPKGEKRPADLVGNAVHGMRVATGRGMIKGSDAEEIGRRLFDWLAAGSPEPKPPGLPDTLYFNGNAEAFGYACQYLEATFKRDKALPAIVDEAKAPDGDSQKCVLRVLHEGGPHSTICLTLNEGVPILHAGDLVAFHIAEYNPSMALSVMNPLGFITAKLRPEFNLMKGWAVAND
jgi:hypothetical protein